MVTSGDSRGDHLIVARIRKPHGLAGELSISIDTDRPEHVFRRGRSLGLRDSSGGVTGNVTVEKLRPATGAGILKLREVSTREGAELLRGHALVMEAAHAMPAGKDEVHYRDLVGLTARCGEDEIGKVADILDLPGGETLLIKGRGKEILVPYVKEMISGVDLEQRVLTLVLPDGLLDL